MTENRTLLLLRFLEQIFKIFLIDFVSLYPSQCSSVLIQERWWTGHALCVPKRGLLWGQSCVSLVIRVINSKGPVKSLATVVTLVPLNGAIAARSVSVRLLFISSPTLFVFHDCCWCQSNSKSVFVCCMQWNTTHAQTLESLTTATKLYTNTATRLGKLCASSAMRAMNSLERSLSHVFLDTHLSGTARHPFAKVKVVTLPIFLFADCGSPFHTVYTSFFFSKKEKVFFFSILPDVIM